MATEFDTGLPSVRHIQSFIRDQNTVELKLLTGDVFTGLVVWQDANAVCLSVDGEPVRIMRAALAHVKIAN